MRHFFVICFLFICSCKQNSGKPIRSVSETINTHNALGDSISELKFRDTTISKFWKGNNFNLKMKSVPYAFYRKWQYKPINSSYLNLENNTKIKENLPVISFRKNDTLFLSSETKSVFFVDIKRRETDQYIVSYLFKGETQKNYIINRFSVYEKCYGSILFVDKNSLIVTDSIPCYKSSMNTSKQIIVSYGADAVDSEDFLLYISSTNNTLSATKDEFRISLEKEHFYLEQLFFISNTQALALLHNYKKDLYYALLFSINTSD